MKNKLKSNTIEPENGNPINEKLGELYKNILKSNPEKLEEEEKAKTLKDLWDNVIEQNLPKTEIVQKWHNMLLQYIGKKDVIFTLRIFGSHKKNEDSSALRRGFLNFTNQDGSGIQTVYVDNYFTSFFYAMALNGYCPEGDDFEKMMKSHQFPIGTQQTRNEKNYAAFCVTNNMGIGSKKNYKIAHIFDAGQNFSFPEGINTIGNFCEKYFPKGKLNEWKTDGSKKYKYRLRPDFSKADRKNTLKFLKAHFLRTVHPINYFLVPKQDFILYTDNKGEIKTEIGEYEPLIEYVKAKIKDRFKDCKSENDKNKTIYDEFIELIAPISSEKNSNNKLENTINAIYGEEVNKKIKETKKVIKLLSAIKCPKKDIPNLSAECSLESYEIKVKFKDETKNFTYPPPKKDKKNKANT